MLLSILMITIYNDFIYIWKLLQQQKKLLKRSGIKYALQELSFAMEWPYSVFTFGTLIKEKFQHIKVQILCFSHHIELNKIFK